VLSVRVSDTPGLSGVILEDDDTPGNEIRAVALISKSFLALGKEELPTFLNSGASDTMFVKQNAFTTYQATSPRSGDSAKAIDGTSKLLAKAQWPKDT
jgi:hypothetical protein